MLIDQDEMKGQTVARKGSGVSRERLGAIGIGVATLAAVGFLFYGETNKTPRSMINQDGEVFKTGRGGIEAPAEPRKGAGRIVMQPTAEPAQAPPTQPAAPAVDLEELRRQEAARLAAEEAARRAAAEAAERERRLSSPMILVDQGMPPAVAHEAETVGKAGGANAAILDKDENAAWGAATANKSVETARASRNARMDATVLQGSIIRGSLHSAIQSDLPGMVRANVGEDVWSADGRRVLIPKGSFLMGEYRSGLARGQTRVFVIWSRVVTPSGLSVDVGSPGTDYLGRAGLAGEVDRHYFERFGSSVLLSIIGGGAAYVAGLGGANSAATTTTGVDARALAAQTLSQEMTKTAQMALQESINIPPTVHVDQGTDIIVMVRRDLDFSRFYPDPVAVALKELKRGGGFYGTGLAPAQGLVRKP